MQKKATGGRRGRAGSLNRFYQKYLWGSYNKYSHEDTEIIIEVSPNFVEIWDTSEDNYAYQLFLDFEKETVTVKQYDQQ